MTLKLLEGEKKPHKIKTDVPILWICPIPGLNDVSPAHPGCFPCLFYAWENRGSGDVHFNLERQPQRGQGPETSAPRVEILCFKTGSPQTHQVRKQR